MIELALIFIVLAIAAVVLYAGSIISNNHAGVMLLLTTFVALSTLWFLVYMGQVMLEDARYEQPSSSTGNITAIYEVWNYTYSPKYTELTTSWKGMYNLVSTISTIMMWLCVIYVFWVILKTLMGKVS